MVGFWQERWSRPEVGADHSGYKEWPEVRGGGKATHMSHLKPGGALGRKLGQVSDLLLKQEVGCFRE